MKSITAVFLALFLQAHAENAVYETFESDGYGEWKVTGAAFGLAPTSSKPAGLRALPEKYADAYYASSAHRGVESTGTLQSLEVKIDKKYLSFLICGGNLPEKTAVQLLIDNKPVIEATGQNDLLFRPITWDLSPYQGQNARLAIIDQAQGPWGVINADHFVFHDKKNIIFPKTKTLKKPAPGSMVSTDVIPGALIPTGSQLKIYADTESTGIVSPTALTIAETGNVYASETHRFRFGVEDNRDHRYWILDDLAAQTTADRRKMHEKWNHKAPIEKLTEISETIRVFIDKDKDGIADESKIYADDFKDLLDGTAAGIMAFNGTIYFANIPHIWSLKDTDGDLLADERTSLQEGFGVRVSFSGHDLNGFALGPDGRIYATIGDRGFNITTKEGKKYSYPNQGAILRFEPDGSHMEVVHIGLRNPKEIAFDQWGTGITVDNNSDQGDRARIVFMMEGADSGWRMGHQILHSFHRTAGIPKRPINRWMQEKMWEPQNALQPADIVPPLMNYTSGPSGLAYNPGTGFAINCIDRFLISDYRGGPSSSGIWKFGIEPQGAGFKIIDTGQFQWGTAVTDLEWGYDGKIYVSDFIGGWSSHDKGRIYTLSHEGLAGDQIVKEVQELITQNFEEFPSNKLALLLAHPDQRIRLRAQIALSSKKDALPYFTEAANQIINPIEQLHGIWGLGMLARLQKNNSATQLLIRLLSNQSEKARGQAAAMLGESTMIDSSPLFPLLADPSLRVRALAALSLARKTNIEAVPFIHTMLIANDNQDPYLRHAGIMALIANSTASEIAKLAKHESPALRLAAVVALQKLQHNSVSNFLFDQHPQVADQAIRAIHDTPIESARHLLAVLLDNYTIESRVNARPLTPMLLRRLIHSTYRLSEPKNIERLIHFAAKDTNPMTERIEALRILADWTEPHVVDQSLGRIAPLEKRPHEEIRAILSRTLHTLFTAQGPLLESALELVIKYKVDMKSLDSGTLIKLISDEKIDGKARAAALNILTSSSPDSLPEILTQASSSSNDDLAAAALTLAAEADPSTAAPALQAALKSKNFKRRQSAWKIIATLPAEHALPLIQNGLQNLTNGKGDPHSTLELLAAARSRTEPAIQAALANYEKAIPTDDPLAIYLPTLQGGDPKNGKRLFETHPAGQCMRCHQAADGHTAGGNAGPSLTGVAKRLDARGLLESLILPSAQIASGFGNTTVTFQSGAQKSGLLYAETDNTITLIEGEKAWLIQKSDLKEFSKSSSQMPAMGSALKPEEMRDLIAWLLTLTEESKNTAPAPVTTPLDPATLIAAEQNHQSDSTMDKNLTEQMALGKSLYEKAGSCITCHGPEGKGTPKIFPPVAQSEWVTGPVENLIKIQLRGLQGEITVNGEKYNSYMAPMAHQTDDEIAAVLTYIRNSFGNKADAVTPEQVKALRSEAGKPPLKATDLIDPATVTKSTPPTNDTPPASESENSDKENTETADTDAYQVVPAAKSKLPTGHVGNLPIFNISFFVIIFLCLIAVFFCKSKK